MKDNCTVGKKWQKMVVKKHLPISFIFTQTISCFFTEKTPLLLEDYSGMLQIENIGTIKVAIGTSGWGCRNSRKRIIKCL